ncbi:unnamed protein product [Parajaminaea phylloscopi]
MSAASLVPLRITITSDTICPFCFLGLRKIQKALSTSPLTAADSASRVFEPQLRFLPYQLDPTLPLDHAVNKREKYIAKFGGAQRVQAMEEMMKKNGEPYGIHFNYDGDVRNTLLSHRLMEKAFAKGGWSLQLALLNTLFPFYFEQAGDPGDTQALSDIGVKAGIFGSVDDARAFFAGKEFEAEVQAGFELARAKSITGVPHFEITAGRQENSSAPTEKAVQAEIPGAQEPDVFVSVFKQIADAFAKANGPASISATGAAGSRC